MTVKELSQLYHLNREVEMDQKRLADLDFEIQRDEARLAVLEAKSTSVSSPAYDGMPKSPSGGNQVERSVAELVDLRDLIARKKALPSECAMTIHAKQILRLTERNRLERYIAHVPVSSTRQIMHLRFINRLGLSQVAYSIGCNPSGASVRMTVKRYLENENTTDQ